MIGILNSRCRDLRFGDAAWGFMLAAMPVSALVANGQIGAFLMLTVVFGGYALLGAALLHLFASWIDLPIASAFVGCVTVLALLFSAVAGSEALSILHSLAAGTVLTTLAFVCLWTVRTVRVRIGDH